MVEYDPKVIEEFARRLYSQSKATTMRHFCIGLSFGVIIFGGISAALVHGYDALIISIGAFIGAVMGYGSGQGKAFEQRLQAQSALCQVRIESNTRR
jgi:hypothetical protein